MKEHNSQTQELNKYIGQLFSESLKVISPVQMIHLIREKISVRGFQQPDKGDILNEMSKLQQTMGELNGQMLAIYDLLKKLP
jgi:nitrate/nitrite-specific signal transduction histidine kinase